jgi:hypothetical protein
MGKSDIALLQAAIAETHRARVLFKARGIIDTAAAVPKAFKSAAEKGLSMVQQQRAALGPAPPHLKGRIAWATELPRVDVGGQEDEEELAACVKYALGLEGGGGVVLVEGQEPAVGMLPELFVELLELLVPKWDPARKGQPLGERVYEVDEEPSFDSDSDDSD